MWYNEISTVYGSPVDYLLKVRLQWTDLAASVSEGEAPYLTRNISSNNFKIFLNDWPYSVPVEIEHYLIWSKLPVIHRDIVDVSIWKRIEHDGLWGFTGQDSPIAVEGPASYAHAFVIDHWPEEIWETAWFLNPTRIQSIPGVVHIHVFSRKKHHE